jgi:hypothetical protein
MINIELSGSNEARAYGYGGKMSIHKLCRKLIDEGFAQHDIVNVWRRGMLCFTPVRLSWWADRDVSEGDAYSARIVKHRPFDPLAFTDK